MVCRATKPRQFLIFGKKPNLKLLCRIREIYVFCICSYLYINSLRENLFSPLRSQIIVVFYDRLHVHCTSSPSISSISQHFSSRTDESEDFLFENGNHRRSKCIGDQSVRSSSTRGWELGTVRGSIDRVTVRALGRVARWFFNSWILHLTRLEQMNRESLTVNRGIIIHYSSMK